MNRRSITPTLFAALVALAATAVLRPARAGDAPAPPAAASDVATIAAGLEAPEPATRAKAAETLGTRYPEAAVAVPVLLDATRDEDATVRAAAVRALRLLGRRGQEDAAKAWTTMSAAGLAFHDEVFRFLGSLGAAVTRTDLAVAFATASTASADTMRAALLGLPLLRLRAPYGEFAMDTGLGDGLGLLAVARPWMASGDAATARTAAAVVTIIGRSAVTGVEATDDGTASAGTLRPLLAAPSPVVRFAGFMLIGVGAPHDADTRAAVLDAAARMPESEAEQVTLEPEAAPFRVTRNHALFAARSLGVAARALVLASHPMPEHLDGVQVRYLLDVGARDEVASAWARELAARSSPRSERPIDPSVVFAIGRDATFAAAAAPALPRLFAAAARNSAASRELLLPAEPEAGSGSGPSGDAAAERGDASATASPCIALAWLAHHLPTALLADDERVLAQRVMRRALSPRARPADQRVAAAVVIDLQRPGLVPPATLEAALASPAPRDDAVLATLLLRAIATVGDAPASIIAIATPYAIHPPEPAWEPDAAERAEHAAGWPFVREALEVRAMGSRVEAPVLRRLAAIDALGAVVGDKAKAKEVLAPLTKDADARVRYRAAKALRRLGA
ncbi:MAG: HEAT repeat domain-containing protein [Planctomycetia bacterium]|nr:HEAT repeat domain-containing protein [Planctomycetia bacterium]